MIPRLLGLFFTIAFAGAFGQVEFPGLYGKITSRPKAGDLAPEIIFTKVLHNAASTPWAPGNLDGNVTVLMFLPYVSGNPEIVTKWNALVEQFKGKPVQFAWIEGEDESTLLPFLKEHSIEGWLFHDPDGGTGRSYGLESPEPVLVGTNRKIVGFDPEFLPSAETINAVLGNRTADILSPEPHRMPGFEDHRPDFAPSYAVHIAPSKDDSGGNFSAMDYWSLQGYTVKRLLAEMLDLNPIRIDLPASIDARARYDFSIVLPKSEDKETMRNLIRQGAEDYFHLVAIRENRLRDVYVLTASGKRPPAAASDAFAGGGFDSSAGFFEIGDPNGLLEDRPHPIDAVSDISMQGTVDEFCHTLENGLDRPVINETKLEGRFEFQVRASELGPQELPKTDFVERLRKELGLVIAPAQRNVETLVYRQH
jgi:uncharacterized protein (TIGR03435 family)